MTYFANQADVFCMLVYSNPHRWLPANRRRCRHLKVTGHPLTWQPKWCSLPALPIYKNGNRSWCSLADDSPPVGSIPTLPPNFPGVSAVRFESKVSPLADFHAERQQRVAVRPSCGPRKPFGYEIDLQSVATTWSHRALVTLNFKLTAQMRGTDTLQTALSARLPA